MNNLWIILSVLTMFTTAFSLLLLKYLNTTKFNILIILGFTYFVSSLIAIFYMATHIKDFNYTLKNISLPIIIFIFLFAILHIFTQQLMSKAIIIAPNISYCHLIVNFNIIITLIASYFLFKEKINIKSLFGIFITLIGISIVIYYSNN
jgi:drug/metabolite transporter (DMT)-like permease